MTTDLGIELVQLVLWWYDKLRAGGSDRLRRMMSISRRHASAQRAALLVSIIGSFLLGAILGTWAFHLQPRAAMFLPISFLLFIIYKDWSTPIADVRELDLTADSELASMGLVQSLLPPELGIYRLFHHRGNKAHRAPDFQSWAERLPHHWRVVILAMSPMTRLDTNAFLDLTSTVQKLREQRRDLILCGLTPRQYKELEKSDLPDVIDPENVCPDMEFAIARAMGRLEEISGQRPVASGQ